MSLPRKGSRAIRVDGHRYRWTVSPDSGWMGIVVEDGGGRGQRLVAVTDYRDAEKAPEEKSRQTRHVTPGLVRQCILEGWAKGWRPQEPGGEVRIDVRH